MEVLLATLIFGLAMAGMGVGVIFSNKALRGSCGGDTIVGADGELISCGACPKHEHDVCPSDDALVRLAQIAHPDPKHHR